MPQQFMVKNKRCAKNLKLIPYIGCKSGFAHIFDSLIPDKYGKKIYDVFGGGGGFAFYACDRFGSENVVYNDHNPIIINLIKTLKKYPTELYNEYQTHYKNSDPDYYLKIRKKDLQDGIAGAGRFYYLAKNAFSGKIRFNSRNKFNSPMRKNAKCPQVNLEALQHLSKTIRRLTVSMNDFNEYLTIKNSFIYLDPPYMNNTNGHYNAVVETDMFINFIKKVEKSNKIMISEQNNPNFLGLSSKYKVFQITLNRSLQYFTQHQSKEIIAINYMHASSDLKKFV